MGSTELGEQMDLTDSGTKYGAILCDPPWNFRTYNKKTAVPGRTGVDPYPTMSVKDMRALDLSAYAAKNCALFMWIVGSHVDVGVELGKAWGFEYKTDVFVWNKGRIGMGYWSRKETETCYLFTRGKPPRKSKGVRQLIPAPRREHSRKPDEQYARIEALVDGPYLELFARQQRAGWDSWGNETNKYPQAAE